MNVGERRLSDRAASTSVPRKGRSCLWRVAYAACFWLGCSSGVPPAAPPAPEAQASVALPPERPARAFAAGMHGAVTSAEARASAVGESVLKRGGNAVDAAIAVAFALGVTYPSAANVGGGGFLLVRFPDGRSSAIDYREVAPGASHRDMFLDAKGEVTEAGQVGPLAAGIPGVVAGLAMAHQRWGSLPWSELLAPAIALARDGVRLDEFQVRDLGHGAGLMHIYANDLRKLPSDDAEARALRAALTSTLATFEKAPGTSYAVGDVWRQPELAATLDAIAAGGARAFYTGPLAQRMAEGVRAMGGIWTAKDLADYRAVEREPVRFTYHGHDIISMPPPSSGGIVLAQILTAADRLNMRQLDYDSPERIHLYLEALRRIFAERNRWVGDPDFISIPRAELLDPERTARRVADIDPERATPSLEIRGSGAVAEPRHTTHFSIVDARGMAVANTFTLNGDFGALVQIPGTGVTLNNEMDDFAAKPGAANMAGLVQGTPNAIEPGKRMASSMSPTIVVRDGQLRAVLGTPGGPTITTTVAQLLMQIVDHGKSLEDAVAAPRIHHQWLPDESFYEAGVPESTLAALRSKGHRMTVEPSIGHANCIERDPASGELRAVADVRRGGGGAVAY
ncbi:gamma-glutamyltransferase [Sorangium sp. So ce341]|uniref:gamma-glutamyltransferase n=1 Tax=Sorangium sp. So ce341 TaxID=3133302 RepID=UPI003F5FD14B